MWYLFHVIVYYAIVNSKPVVIIRLTHLYCYYYRKIIILLFYIKMYFFMDDMRFLRQASMLAPIHVLDREFF